MEKKLKAKNELKYDKPKLTKFKSAHGAACTLGAVPTVACIGGRSDLPPACSPGKADVS